MIAFIDSQVVEDCMNHNSYGEICVGCNCCGRYGEEGKNVTRQNKYTPVRPLCGRTGVFIRLWTYSQGLDIPQQKAE